jgi:hypothetical protein
VKQAAKAPPIELKVTDLQQLFNTIDPSPFHERDLDADAEEFIVASAEERPKDAKLRLVIHFTQPDPHAAGAPGNRCEVPPALLRI